MSVRRLPARRGLVPRGLLGLVVGKRPPIGTWENPRTFLHQQGLSFLLLPHRFAQMKSDAQQSVA